jgi:AcrR family transcriptional regulator
MRNSREMTPRPASIMTRPDDACGRDRIIDAAGELLASSGLRAMTLDAVASRARVSEQAISRWWPSEEALALDVLRREWIAVAAEVRRAALRCGL